MMPAYLRLQRRLTSFRTAVIDRFFLINGTVFTSLVSIIVAFQNLQSLHLFPIYVSSLCLLFFFDLYPPFRRALRVTLSNARYTIITPKIVAITTEDRMAIFMTLEVCRVFYVIFKI